MNTHNLVGRVKSILLTPRTEWPAIAAENDTLAGIYTGYILILAAIPAVKLFLSYSVIGTTVPFVGTYRPGVLVGLTSAITTYALSLIGTFIVALIVDGLAPAFGGTRNRVQALKVVAYAYTAAWVAALIGIIPGLGLLSALAGAIYSLYLLYVGLPFTMKSPTDRSLGYTVVTVIVAIIVSVVLGLVMRAVGGYGAGPFGNPMGMSSSTLPAAAPAAGGAVADGLNDYARRLGDATKKLDSAQKSGDPAAKSDALGQLVGAAMGSGGKVESLPPDAIKTFLPAALDGLQRTQQAVDRTGAIGMQTTKATATYSDGANRTLSLQITDIGSLKGLVGFAAGWSGVQQDSQTDTGYDKTYESGGQLVHEQWNTQSQSGEYSTFIANRFAVTVSGHAADMADLKRAAAQVDAGGLAALKDSGVTAN